MKKQDKVEFKGLPRPCKKCKERMIRHGKYQRYCEKCYKQNQRIGINKALEKMKLNKLKKELQ